MLYGCSYGIVREYCNIAEDDSALPVSMLTPRLIMLVLANIVILDVLVKTAPSNIA